MIYLLKIFLSVSKKKKETVEGFSVFKSSKSEEPVVKEENEQPENDLSLEKKKFYQQLEVLLPFLFLEE